MTSVRATQEPPGPAVAGFNTYRVRPAPLSCLKFWEGPERNRIGRMQQELGSTRIKHLASAWAGARLCAAAGGQG